MNGAVHGDATITASTPERERIERPVVRGPRGRDRRGHEHAELEHARQIEREQEEQEREPGHDGGRLQLEAPAELLARGAQTRPAASASSTNDRMTPAL